MTKSLKNTAFIFIALFSFSVKSVSFWSLSEGDEAIYVTQLKDADTMEFSLVEIVSDSNKDYFTVKILSTLNQDNAIYRKDSVIKAPRDHVFKKGVGYEIAATINDLKTKSASLLVGLDNVSEKDKALNLLRRYYEDSSELIASLPDEFRSIKSVSEFYEFLINPESDYLDKMLTDDYQPINNKINFDKLVDIGVYAKEIEKNEVSKTGSPIFNVIALTESTIYIKEIININNLMDESFEKNNAVTICGEICQYKALHIFIGSPSPTEYKSINSRLNDRVRNISKQVYDSLYKGLYDGAAALIYVSNTDELAKNWSEVPTQVEKISEIIVRKASDIGGKPFSIKVGLQEPLSLNNNKSNLVRFGTSNKYIVKLYKNNLGEHPEDVALREALNNTPAQAIHLPRPFVFQSKFAQLVQIKVSILPVNGGSAQNELQRYTPLLENKILSAATSYDGDLLAPGAKEKLSDFLNLRVKNSLDENLDVKNALQSIIIESLVAQ